MVLPAESRIWLQGEVPAAARRLREEGLSDVLSCLLARRGVSTRSEAEAFLAPGLSQLHPPELLAGMAEAVACLDEVRLAGGKVAVVGDYDVDGITGTGVLLAVLRACGLPAEPILPQRMEEGYGFQPVHVIRALSLGATAVCTVDCGTRSHEAVGKALDAGLRVVVVDHHLPGESLPSGAVQINPKQESCAYPDDRLAAAGLALKLAQAVAVSAGREIPLESLLRLASLGTIADMVPLLGENRVIAALGLEELPRTRSLGLKALMERSRVTPPLSASDVGFRLGPRINAAGRLHSADPALELLLTRDPRRAEELATLLDQWNTERQALQARVLEEARREVLARDELPVLVVAGNPGWHKGVLGIAAGQIARELRRPTLLFQTGDELATASGRSVSGVDLHAFLEPWRPRFERFGGHAQAVGLTVSSHDLPGLRREWEEVAQGAFSPELLVRRYEYELTLRPSEATPELMRELVRLEPHGMGNSRPLLRLGPMSLRGEPRTMGRGHLRAVAGDGGGMVQLLGWGWAERRAELESPFEALGRLKEDRYTDAPCLELEDVRVAEEPVSTV